MEKVGERKRYLEDLIDKVELDESGEEMIFYLDCASVAYMRVLDNSKIFNTSCRVFI